MMAVTRWLSLVLCSADVAGLRCVARIHGRAGRPVAKAPPVDGGSLANALPVDGGSLHELFLGGATLSEIAAQTGLTSTQVRGKIGYWRRLNGFKTGWRKTSQPVVPTRPRHEIFKVARELVVDGMVLASRQDVVDILTSCDELHGQDAGDRFSIPLVRQVLLDHALLDARQGELARRDRELLRAYLAHDGSATQFIEDLGTSKREARRLYRHLREMLPPGAIRRLRSERLAAMHLSKLNETFVASGYSLQATAMATNRTRNQITRGIDALGVGHLALTRLGRGGREGRQEYSDQVIREALRAAAETEASLRPRSHTPYALFQREWFRNRTVLGGTFGVHAVECGVAWNELSEAQREAWHAEWRRDVGGEADACEAKAGKDGHGTSLRLAHVVDGVGFGGPSVSATLSITSYARWHTQAKALAEAQQQRPPPHSHTILKRYGVWSAACQAAGLQARKRHSRIGLSRWSDDAILAAVAQYVAQAEARGLKATLIGRNGYQAWSLATPNQPRSGVLRTRMLGSHRRFATWSHLAGYVRHNLQLSQPPASTNDS